MQKPIYTVRQYDGGYGVFEISSGELVAVCSDLARVIKVWRGLELLTTINQFYHQ